MVNDYATILSSACSSLRLIHIVSGNHCFSEDLTAQRIENCNDYQNIAIFFESQVLLIELGYKIVHDFGLLGHCTGNPGRDADVRDNRISAEGRWCFVRH